SDTTSSLYSRTHRLVLIISIISFKITHPYSNKLDLSYSFLNHYFLNFELSPHPQSSALSASGSRRSLCSWEFCDTQRWGIDANNGD
ncbi:MAG: hypothetical protein QSU88_10095, partial [Candidatus Methanoperedens sp.]|nr:hypothetical protein [Candidatus Methanoperedens sp.]